MTPAAHELVVHRDVGLQSTSNENDRARQFKSISLIEQAQAPPFTQNMDSEGRQHPCLITGLGAKARRFKIRYALLRSARCHGLSSLHLSQWLD